MLQIPVRLCTECMRLSFLSICLSIPQNLSSGLSTAVCSMSLRVATGRTVLLNHALLSLLTFCCSAKVQSCVMPLSAFQTISPFEYPCPQSRQNQVSNPWTKVVNVSRREKQHGLEAKGRSLSRSRWIVPVGCAVPAVDGAPFKSHVCNERRPEETLKHWQGNASRRLLLFSILFFGLLSAHHLSCCGSIGLLAREVTSHCSLMDWT